MKKILAQSENFKLSGIWEEAHLEGPGIVDTVLVGDFYGDVQCGCIDARENWCITAGQGLVIYHLVSPFEPYKYDSPTTQWVELKRSDPNWFVEAIYQIENDIVRIVVDVLSSVRGVYDLDINDLQLTKRI